MPPPREKYLDTVAQFLAGEEARKAGKSSPKSLTRVFRNDPNSLRGLETADVYPDRAVLGRRPDSDRAALESEGYEWRPVDEYSTVVANPQVPVAPPPGKLPFISGTPTHQGKPAPAAAPPASGMEQAMSLAAASSRPLSGTQPAPPPLAMPAQAAPPEKKRSGSREAMLVSKTTETGSTPTARPYTPLDTAAPAPGQDRFQGLPEGVASFLRKRSGLEEAQQDANRRAMAVELASAFNQIGTGIAGSRYNPNAFDNQREAAQQPVADYQALAEEGRTEDALARQQTMDERALQEAAREAQRQEREFQYRQGRDTAGDTLRQKGLEQEMEIARMRADEGRKDRYLRSQELLMRAKEGAEARKSAAEQKRTDMLARQDEKDQAELAKRLQAASDAKNDLDLVMRYATGTEGEDIPGIGWGVSGLPGALVSQEGSDLRQAAIRLYRNKVRMESGQTVTPQEAATALEARGMGTWKTEGQWRSGMKALAGETAAAMRNIESGFNPSVVATRRERGGITSADIPTAPAVMESPDGQQYEVDAGEVLEAERNGWKRIR